MSCCAGATEPLKEVKDGQTTYYYPLDYEVIAVLDNNNSIQMKDCGCTRILNNTVQSVAEFEPILCWKNKNTGSIYTPEKFAETLSNHGLISLEVGLIESYSDEPTEITREEEIFEETIDE